MAAIERALPGIADRPALLMWAEKDRAFNPTQLQRWRTLFRNLDGPHLLPSAGHFWQEDAPDEIVPRLRAWADAQFRRDVALVPRFLGRGGDCSGDVAVDRAAETHRMQARAVERL
jgi:hypothetical protein